MSDEQTSSEQVEQTSTENTESNPLEATDQTSSEADAALQELMDEADGVEDTGRDDKGRFKAKAEETESEDENTEDEEESEDHQRAMAALKRYDHPDLEAFAKSKPDKFLEFGLKQAKIQDDLDEKAEAHAVTSRELAEYRRTSGQTDEQTKDDSNTPAVTDQQFDVSEFVQPLAKHFEEVYGEDAAKPLTTAFTGLATKLQTQFDARIEQMQGAVVVMQMDTTRKELLNEYPKLKSKDRWESIQSRMLKTGLSKEQPDILSLADFCCQAEFAKEILADSKQTLKEAKSAKRNSNAQKDRSVPSAPESAREVSEAAATLDSLSDAMLDARHDGDEKKYGELKERRDKLQNT